MTYQKLNFPQGSPRLVSAEPLPEIFSVFAARLKADIKLNFIIQNDLKEEEYILSVSQTGATVKASTHAGLFYGLQELISDVRDNGFREISVQAAPILPQRVLKLYLPEPTEKGYEEFCRIIDFAARCKYNTIMLELGGALEYKSHPEINEGWLEYAAFMNEYPGKTIVMQNCFGWEKNSIHSENGGGKIVPQEMFLKLVEYCKERFMDIIPEMPSLSHSDYLLTRHRELAERPEDPFPDCCCPLNPGYHKLFQDLLEEVIDLIHPKKIHICHDECYTIGLCPECRKKEVTELYAGDINRIGAWLNERGIKPIVWGEKFLDSHWRNGDPIGGAEKPAPDGKEAQKALYPSADLITCDLEIFHWYWTVNRKYDNVYSDHGWDFTFANLNPTNIKDWKRRVNNPHANGVCISNWGETSIRTLQRNGIFYDLLYAAHLVWNPEYGSEDFSDLDPMTMVQLYNEFAPAESPEFETITVTHTVQTDIKYKLFFDGFMLDEEHFRLGNHVFQSEKTGEKFYFPVIFGTNISNSNISTERREGPEFLADAYTVDMQYREVSGETLPFRDSEKVMWYQCRYQIPAGSGPLKYLRFESVNELVPEVRIKE
ncbi:MAG: hypothetical protein E7040_03805 [Lentisphaerae bacterium]|nr:hypothetical protein [Lentisphaerota bacterium]